MEALWTAITTVISNLATAFNTVGSELMSNAIFQLVIGVVVFGIAMGYVFTLVRKLRRKGK